MLDDIGRVADHPGNELAAGRQFHLFPDAPFMLVARIAHFDAVGAGFYLEHQVDDILERHVRDMRRVKLPQQM